MGDLKPFRDEIDALDEQLIDLLSRRFAVVRKVGELKAREGLDVVQSARAEEVLSRVASMAESKNLDPELMRKIWAMMIDQAHVIERQIKEQANNKESGHDRTGTDD